MRILGYVVVGAPNEYPPVDAYIDYVGPSGGIGPGGVENGSSGRGDAVGIDKVIHEIFVPEGYVPGAPLTDSMSFDNATLAGLV